MRKPLPQADGDPTPPVGVTVQELVRWQAKVARLQDRVDQLEETQRKRNQWLREAKIEAGYDTAISFDLVWKQTLEKAKEYRKLEEQQKGGQNEYPSSGNT